MAMEITRRACFCAAHRLHNSNLSDEENRRVYGNCNHEYGHGHNYVMEVSVEGDPDPVTGMIMNLAELDEIIKTEIIQHVDHHHFNFDVPFMKDVIPTIENMVIEFWKILAPKIANGKLKRIKLGETENNFVTYTGPDF
jgi:6-pyruvoyltetrahydropterin/6-carboxytetrahydropterin synthase